MKLRTLTLLSLSILIFAGAGCKKKTPAPLPPTTPKVEPAKERQGPPTVISFTAEPSTVLRGESTTLRWNVMGASEIVIDSGVGAVDATGTRRVTPAGNTTYNLVAKGPGGTANAAVQVVVTTPPPPPPPVVQPTTPTKSLQERLSTDVQDIYFDYDKSEVREDARATLQRNVEGLRAILRDFPNAVISVEGHCDERGSAEYNLGLGDRRSTSAKEFLTQAGVSGDRLRTISYGKEKPQCTEESESCWQKNRRVHFAAQ